MDIASSFKNPPTNAEVYSTYTRSNPESKEIRKLQIKTYVRREQSYNQRCVLKKFLQLKLQLFYF